MPGQSPQRLGQPQGLPLGDYIPCLFSSQERAEFKGKLWDIENTFRGFLKTRGAKNFESFSILGQSQAALNASIDEMLPKQSDRDVAKARLAELTKPPKAPDDVS